MPPLQVSPPQQSAATEQRPPAIEHAQRPPVHDAPLQQSEFDVHAPPPRLQHVPMVVALVALHESEPQQRGLDPPQVAPPMPHMALDIWHWPLLHTCPVGQSMLLVHCVVERAQRPLMQLSSPQQWRSVVQVPPSARQQSVSPCEDAHMVPLAHMGIPPGMQAEPAGSGVIVPSTHVPLVHERPEQQGDEVLHVLPAALQRRQRPPTHESEGLVHSAMPVQQRWPSLPQMGVGDAPQRMVIVLQVKPDSHAARPQQGSPSPPQDMPEVGLHVPDMHESPEAQAVPPQQG